MLGGYNRKTRKYVKDMHLFNASNLNNVKRLPSMTTEIRNSKAVCLKGEVYVLGGRDYCDGNIMCVQKYTPSLDACNEVAYIFDERADFCVCAFMDKIFIIGGYCLDDNFDWIKTNSCLQFNSTDNSWKEICEMYEDKA